MDTYASHSSKGKDTNVSGDDSLTSNIQELRKKAEELRKQEYKEILDSRESVLKELFYMISKSDKSDYMTEIDVSKVDQTKLQEFLHKHQLPENMDALKSTQPTFKTASQSDPFLTNKSQVSQTYQPNNQPNIQSQNQNDQTTQVKKQKRVSLPPVERMITRAASGAINPKSVDEILKDAERHSSIGSSVTSTSPTTATIFKLPTTKLTIPQKKQTPQRVSTVLPRNGEARPMVAPSMGRGLEHNQARSFDRETLISNYNNQPLYKLLQNPKKALITENWTVACEEVKNIRVLERIDQLKHNGMWSFQQIESFRDPPRNYTHWDYLLDEMKDFKKERKWKIAAAFHVSRWVKAWFQAENKADVCVNSRIPGRNTPTHQINIHENHEEASSSSISTSDGEITHIKSEPDDGVQDLNDLPVNQSMLSDEVMIDVESVDDDASTRPDANQANTKSNDSIIMPPPISPSVLLTLRQRVINLPADAFLCCLDGPDGQVYDVDSIFPDLPPYEPLQRSSEKDVYYDNIHCNRIIPISKHMLRRPKSEKAARKRAIKKMRIENDCIDVDKATSSMLLFAPRQPYEQQPKIHVKAPRPDQEPSYAWYPEDDELLMSLTKQYQFNWELIADTWNSLRGILTGYPRTPWACFNRWTQKDDMSQFNCQEWTEESNSILTPEGNDETSSSTAGLYTIHSRPKRDIPKKIPRQEIMKQRRNSNLMEAMRKSAKKRQDAAMKQGQIKKTIDQSIPFGSKVLSPIELSRIKSEHERQAQAALLEQRQAAALAYQAHVRPMIMRPQAPTGISYRPHVATANHIQALVMQQQQQRAMAQQRMPTQPITQATAMAQAQSIHVQHYYNQQLRAQQARAAQAMLQQGTHTPGLPSQSLPSQQLGQQSPSQPPQQSAPQSQVTQPSQQATQQ
ncbi:19791_t:CDS:10 [Racocetra persica]|uniref:19791_t:CDS:1 n=1 Tax=Racocetra persica TaxID=160502 RepID=A0ACA9KTY6_9GLOM|nr:19791_t:CDS:10 [Racocetra persica]